MTSKEAFEILKRYEAELSITKQTEVAYDDVISARYEISKLVERDTLKKPQYGLNQNGKLDYICPTCTFDVVLKERFCSHCGQRLDWSNK